MLLSLLALYFFLPHPKNNHRAKLLHSLSIVSIALSIITFRLSLAFLPNVVPVVLGYNSDIKPEKIVELTNKERTVAGIGELRIDPLLTKAALAKASDMLARDYWSHNAPDGRKPWAFITEMGYQYRFAGENLARDFSQAEDVITGWMNSPSHKENLLSSKYQDIGIAVVEGDLAGVQTTLVVQFFGAKMGVSLGEEPKREASVAGFLKEEPPRILSNAQDLLSPFATTKSLALMLTTVLVGVFLVDMIIIKQRNVMRVSSRSFAHFLFLGMILIAILVAKEGLIK